MTTSAPLTPARRILRWTKRLAGVTTLMLIAAVPATYFGAPVLAQHKWTRHKIEKALTRALSTPVQINATSWSWTQGLILNGVTTPAQETAMTGTSFAIGTLQIAPDASRLLRGKLRARVLIEDAEIVVRDASAEAPRLRLPKFCKTLKIRGFEVRNGTFVWDSLHYDQSVRVDRIEIRGAGEAKGRKVKLDLAEIAGRMNEKPLAARGVLTVTTDGVAGEIETNDSADALIPALRAANLTLKSPAPLSEPF